ncbi:MAG: hypothetical protein KDC44_14740, partial [Phaeodactylibacter sp.]|nr:hypothetical protein [Phaeodactylibacter sp.]
PTMEAVVTVDGNLTYVDWVVYDWNNFQSMQFAMRYDPDLFNVIAAEYYLPNLDNSVNAINDSLILVAWISDDLSNGSTVPDGTSIITLTFNGAAVGDCDFKFTDTPIFPIEFYTISGPVSVTFIDGDCLPPTLGGQIYFDTNLNCSPDPDEYQMPDMLVKLEGPTTTYTLSNYLGSYNFAIPEGTYNLSVVDPNDLWETCEPSYEIEVSFDQPSLNFDIPIQPVADCPSLFVELSTPFLRRCVPNTYVVNYANLGSTTEPDVAIELALDPYLLFNSSSISPSSVDGLVYQFDIGDLEPGASGQFLFKVEVDCEAVLGQTHCIRAKAIPANYCFIDPSWNGARLVLEGTCVGDQIEFTVTNVGQGDMTDPQTYRIIEDDQIIILDEIAPLAAGQSIPIPITATGATYRLEVDQVDLHPGFSAPSLTIEACDPDGDGEFSLGYVNQFPQDEGDYFVDYDCRTNIGSFDPNDKTGYPGGYGDAHLIEANTPLEYHIRFQNTGTDTALRVLIRDTLPLNLLDPGSLAIGPSSHPMKWWANEAGVLHFLFDPIALVDSTANEPESHGFVHFKIRQRAG